MGPALTLRYHGVMGFGRSERHASDVVMRFDYPQHAMN
jgi:hypothetical protein